MGLLLLFSNELIFLELENLGNINRSKPYNQKFSVVSSNF